MATVTTAALACTAHSLHPPQSDLLPLVLARDLFVQHAFSPAHFLDHAAYDCGRLQGS